MRLTRILGLIIVLLPAMLLPVPAAFPAAHAAPAALSEADVAELVAPSVLRVVTSGGMGSGVAINRGVLTSAHVVEDAERVEVVKGDGSRAPAVVRLTDTTLDLAILTTELDLRPVAMEPASRQRMGETVIVLGYPYAELLGEQPTITRGLLSAVREIDGVVFVQTDAAINPGNSGGAIVNMSGKLIGVAAFRLRGSTGLNFGVATESINAFFAPVPADGYEPDDAAQHARPIEPGAPGQERNLHTPGDNDWVTIPLQAGERFLMLAGSSSCPTRLALYGADGESTLAEDDGNGPDQSSFVRFTAREAGTHYGRVRHLYERVGVCRSYEIRATVLPGLTPDSYEPDDSMEEAHELQVDGPAQERSLHMPEDNDWLFIALNGGDRVEVFTSGRSCDTYLYFYGRDGASVLVENDDYGFSVTSRVEYPVAESGTYYVRVRHFDENGACDSYQVGARLLA